jgi:hypothetical protein
MELKRRSFPFPLLHVELVGLRIDIPLKKFQFVWQLLQTALLWPPPERRIAQED